ncbi:MAG: hypothetical protein WCG27_08435, partial [Pseudomonadota bacterium]
MNMTFVRFSALLLLLATLSYFSHSMANTTPYIVTQVSDGLYRGPRPPDAASLAELKAMGINTIINLEDDKKAVAAEKVIVE